MNSCKRLLFAVLCATLFAVAAPSSGAETSEDNSAVRPLPSDADLDAMVASHKWMDLGAALSDPHDWAKLTAADRWLHTRVLAGGNFFLVDLFARDLWFAQQNMKSAEAAERARRSAAVMTLYAYALLLVDGPKCEDKSAPIHRFDQLIQSRLATFAYIHDQPEDVRAVLVDRAVALERQTAPLRTNDYVLCSDGLEETMAGLAHGSQQEVPTPPGMFGRTIAVTAPPGWQPKFLPQDTYGPLQEQARAGLRDGLLAFVNRWPPPK